MERLETRELLASFLVTNTNDTGSGSLRQAILDSNATPEVNDIGFTLAGTGPFTIGLSSALPAITNSVFIGGTGPAGTPLIALNGTNAGNGASGLDIRADNCTINGLIIGGFQSRGILVGGASGTQIQNSYIGTDATGTAARPNGVAGIELAGTSSLPVRNTTIGGTNAGEPNIIAFNGGKGVVISGTSTSTGNQIVGNSIYSNAGIGIDLGNDGVTQNSATSPGNGPNLLQNFPVITAAEAGATPALSATLTSVPSTTFRVDFYSNGVTDASGYGQGQTYLGSTNVTTNSNGTVSFNYTPSAALTPGSYVSATATDPNGNTSEFSATRRVSAGSIQLGSATYSVSESGGQATITVNRVGGSSGVATVNYATSNGTALAGADYTATSGTITFADGDSTPKTFTIPITNDQVAEGNETVNITLSGVTGAGLGTTTTAVLTIVDDDTTGFVVTPTSGLVTTEVGGNATFTVRLTSQPLAPVTIPLSSSNPGEGIPDPTSLTFTASNWNVPQTVTVRGVADQTVDGNVAYTIITGAAVSADPGYNGLNPDDVSATNLNADVAGVTVTPTSGLVTTELGGTASFAVRLNSRPTGNVTINLASGNTGEDTISTPSLVFTPANWNVAQTVVVTGVADNVVDGNQVVTITTSPAVSSDANYNGLDPANVTVTNLNSDAVGVTINPTGGLTTSESGGTASFTVRLNTRPTADVTLTFTSQNPAEGTVVNPTVTFTAANWNVPQTVNVVGVDDLVADGTVGYFIGGSASSTDANYNGVAIPAVAAANLDNDNAGISVSATGGLVTSESGNRTAFNVRLNSQPTANVVVPIRSSNTAEGTVSTASLVFTPADWNVPQTIIVTGVDDQVADGNVSYAILTGPAQSTDAFYNNLGGPNVGVVNVDNDVAGIAVVPITPLTTTAAGGAATLAIVLRSKPVSPVAVNFASTDPSQGTVSPAVLVFTPDNWNIPQLAGVIGSGRNSSTGPVAYAVTITAASQDPRYNGVTAAPVALTNINIPPVPISGVQVVTVTVKKTKSQAIAVGFGGAVNPASATNLGNYLLTGAGRDRKFGTRDDVRLALTAATYNAATNTVTLTPNRKVSLTAAPVQLRVIAAGLLDLNGRPVDGNRDGLIGGDLVATINKKRVTLS